MSKVIAFTNQKGGVGKTTSCVNISTFLALMGKKVLMIDIDPQGNATSGIGIRKSSKMLSIYNVITGEISIEKAIESTIVPNLDVLPASIDLAGVEVEMVYMESREKVLHEILKKARNSYDYITIDCPPSLGLLTVNALTSADSVLIPIQCEFFALEGLSQLMNTVRLVKKRLNPRLSIEGVLLTMRDSRSNLGQQVADEILKYFAKTVFNTSIPRNIRLAEAPSHGLPIYLYDKNCAGSKAYLKLTQELLDRNNDTYKNITIKKAVKNDKKRTR